MDETPNLGLPYIMAAQSQKHVTHNEAIRALDAMVQLSVLDRNLSAPPGSPVEGARYIVGPSPSGAWSGHAGKVAAYQDAAWMFYAPREGWIAWIADEDIAVVWSGSSWGSLATGEGGGGGGGEGDFSTLGINATADTTNRLAVAADATLLSHDGDDHRLKINKAAAADTASLLYQTAFSGRAELGLAGDDNFHFKVSADGSTWKEAILIDRSTGGVSFPFTSLGGGGGGGGGREILTANRTYYVRTNGSDSNNGLANTSGGAFATLQKAVDVATSLDLGVYLVTIQVADGTYTAGVVCKTYVGAGPISIVGNTSTPDNVFLNVTGDNCFSASSVLGKYVFRGFKLKTTTGGYNFNVSKSVVDFGELIFDASAWGRHINIDAQSYVTAVGNWSIVAGTTFHIVVNGQSYLLCPDRTVTLTGTPAFASYFINVSDGSFVLAYNMTFSGSATGARHRVANCAIINTLSAGTSYFPGNAAGSGTNPGASPYGLYL